jgi:zinc transport system substrate-binding protein
MSGMWRGLAVACGLAATFGCTPAAAAELKVVVTIKPLHALVAQVMAGVGDPDLIVKGAASPHAYSVKPSEARALHNADVFVRMSEAVEPFTAKLVTALPERVTVMSLQDTPGMHLLAQRATATFQRHPDGQGRSHRHVRATGHEHGHSDSDGIDGHAWLDPQNAKAMVEHIARTLAAKDPANAARYRANAETVKTRLNALADELEADLKPVVDKPYIVFHDAFQYLERRYGLNVVGSISVNPDVPPSGKRLVDLRRKVRALEAVCVFAEPQVDARLVANLVEGTQARTGILDPEGGGLDAGPDLYFTLMRNLAAALRSCLVSPA